MNVIVRVSTAVNPTENEEKVRTAITNIFPVELHIEDFGILRLCGEGDIESLRMLHRKFREERILDAARHILKEGISESSTQFQLNKQAAFVNKVNFPVGEESLGSIHVEIEAAEQEDLLKVIDWLAPHTMDGKPVEEIEL